MEVNKDELNKKLNTWAGTDEVDYAHVKFGIAYCFKWLVPKAIEELNRDFNWDKKGCLNRIFKDWQRIYWNSKGILSYAHALCLAIEELIDSA